MVDLHILPTRWCPSSWTRSVGEHKSNNYMVYRWYITIVKGMIIPLQLGAPPCMVFLNQRSHHLGGSMFCSWPSIEPDLGNSGSAIKRYHRAVAASSHDWLISVLVSIRFHPWWISDWDLSNWWFPKSWGFPIIWWDSGWWWMVAMNVIFPEIFPDANHGAGIFTYIETPKITQLCR